MLIIFSEHKMITFFFTVVFSDQHSVSDYFRCDISKYDKAKRKYVRNRK